VPSAPLPLSAFTHLALFADRVQKLRDARSEASKEIEEYKKAKEEEFKAFQASVRLHLFLDCVAFANDRLL